MTFIETARMQLGCLWEGTASQANSIWEGATSTVYGCYDSIEYHTDQMAQVVFGINDSREAKQRVLYNYVTPLFLLVGATRFFLGGKASLFVATAAVIHFFYVAKKKDYI